MSMISKQIEELRFYAKDRKGELARLINDAADTIEMLSEKLHASNMERSSQYYNGGWIPCSERPPEEDKPVFVYLFDDSPYIAWFCGGRWHTEEFVLDEDEEPAAWLPLPKPYKENTE